MKKTTLLLCALTASALGSSASAAATKNLNIYCWSE